MTNERGLAAYSAFKHSVMMDDKIEEMLPRCDREYFVVLTDTTKELYCRAVDDMNKGLHKKHIFVEVKKELESALKAFHERNQNNLNLADINVIKSVFTRDFSVQLEKIFEEDDQLLGKYFIFGSSSPIQEQVS